ncbi:hypothetical protein KUTeg_023567 [Tegillarca granosa]|uniref:Uncharacterized protein n=1 Tax=Tegillarca granosa TaxID=220873 RepID=A0ABQ9E6L4_TEGGR|nr:hypothetical protein KUTeg_023567 [Tegillarca granosa]
MFNFRRGNGGTDITGNPVITFPVLPGQEQQKWRQEDIDNVLRYYTEKRGTVAVFYILKPRSKTKSSLLKKLLGLKKKKGEITFINQFRVVFLSNQAELHHQIEPSQLTLDYGGRLPYDHQAWAVFHKLCAIITEQFWPNMMDHPKHASSLSQAEMNRTHFVTSLYEPAKSLLWYKEALDFIPNSLCGRAVNNRNRSACLPAPTGWRESVRAFLRKHQAPREDHMIELDTYVHPSIDKSTKTQARLLSNRIRVLINILFNAHLDITTLCNIHAWKQEKHSEFNEDPIRTTKRERYLESKYEESPGRRRPVNTRLKRKVNKSRTFRENETFKDTIPVKRENTNKHIRTLSRSSSTDTELLTRDKNYSERYVCLASPDSGYKDYGTVRSMDDLRNDRKQSIDSLSVNSIDPDTDFEDSDNLIDCIQRVTSDWSISSDQKLHYVSNLLMSADSKNFNQRNPVESRHTPSKQISELNKRLTRSLGNIINMDNEDDFAPDTPTVESVSTGDIIDLKEKNTFDFETSDCIVAFPISYLNGHRYPFDQEDDEDDTAPETTDNARQRMFYEPSSNNSSPTSPDADSHKSLLASQRALEASLRRTDLLLKKIQMSSRLREQSRLRRLVSRGESMRAVKPDRRPAVENTSTLQRKNSNVSFKTISYQFVNRSRV